MNVESGILLHMGINYLLTPPPNLDMRKFLDFQGALLDEGIDYGEARHSDKEIHLRRANPPLQIRVLTPHPPMGQLLIVAPQPEDGLEMFGRKAEAIVNAFGNTWPVQHQIVSCDCTIRYLYESSRAHAFEEIWESRLKQSKENLAIFGSPVGGGGLRFVMPVMPTAPEPVEIEVKIESYLKDPRKLYVDVRFKWPQTRHSALTFEPLERLKTVDRFIEDKALAFMES